MTCDNPSVYFRRTAISADRPPQIGRPLNERIDTADEECIDCGYEPELQRTLGSFQIFAISFAFISVAVGIFATYDSVLATAGPVGIWLWIFAAVGQTLVALVVAQFAARIALSGSSSQWASRLANPKIGWLFGWLTFWYLAIAVVALDNALASQAIMPLVGMPENEGTARLITVVILVVQAVMVIASTKLLGLITSSAVGIELAIVVVLVIGLGAVMLFSGSGDLGNLTSRGVTAGDPPAFAFLGPILTRMPLLAQRAGRRGSSIGFRGVKKTKQKQEKTTNK